MEAQIPIFVYGTLLSGLGFPMHRTLAALASFMAPAATRGRLLKVDWYPALVDGEDTVLGELYQVRDAEALFSRLDRYEGCSPVDPIPHEYIREQATVSRLDTGETLLAWRYRYLLPAVDLEIIADGDFRGWHERNGHPVRFDRAISF